MDRRHARRLFARRMLFFFFTFYFMPVCAKSVCVALCYICHVRAMVAVASCHATLRQACDFRLTHVYPAQGMARQGKVHERKAKKQKHKAHNRAHASTQATEEHTRKKENGEREGEIEMLFPFSHACSLSLSSCLRKKRERCPKGRQKAPKQVPEDAWRGEGLVGWDVPTQHQKVPTGRACQGPRPPSILLLIPKGVPVQNPKPTLSSCPLPFLPSKYTWLEG